MMRFWPSFGATERANQLQRWWLLGAGLLAVVVFAILAGRFWHPYYGFTKFVQLDAADAVMGIHEIREHPVFVYEGFNGYGCAAYTQIAFHPAIGNVPYRARRILGSALAWVLAGGNPARIAGPHAGLNVAVWLARSGSRSILKCRRIAQNEQDFVANPTVSNKRAIENSLRDLGSNLRVLRVPNLSALVAASAALGRWAKSATVYPP